MPLYEYQCRSCGDVSEAFQRISDPPLATCDACGGELKKLISAPAFQFKGSGWYVTDYAGKGGKDGNGKGDSEGKESKAKDGDSKTDSKSDSSDSKSETKASSSKPELKTKSERIAS